MNLTLTRRGGLTVDYVKKLLLSTTLLSCSVSIQAFDFKYQCTDEAAMMVKRLPRIQRAISAFMSEEDVQLDEAHIPNIGVTFSGGGWVAAIAELGMLTALRDIGLLDGVATLATSSGSTWMLSTWLNLSAQNNKLATFEEIKAYLKPRLAEGFIFNKDAIEDYLETFVQRHKKGLPFDITCIWGEALTRQFLDCGDDRSKEYFLHQAHGVAASGDIPLPLFTSLLKPDISWTSSATSWVASFVKDQPQPERAYLEYSPFITRLFGENTPWISTKDLGVTWNYLVGTWGSAYAGSFYDNLSLAHNMLKGKRGVSLAWLQDKCSGCVGTNPFSPSIPNFMKKCNNQFKGQSVLRPVDSGIELKVPFPPLLDRNTKIMIVGDVSSDSEYKNGRHSVIQAKEWANSHGRLFPQIPEKLSLTDEVPDLIIDKKNKDAPIIIYFKGAPADMKPTNDETLFNKIYNDMYNKVVNNEELFKKAITAHLERM